MEAPPFYAQGLYFSCRRCSVCCRHDPGFVFVSAADVEALAQSLRMQYTDCVQTYCRWVPSPGGGERLSLREKANFDCIFWDGGCTVYENRPLQCRTFPFWDSSLVSRAAWEALDCPGAGSGEMFSREYIEECLARREAEPVLTRGRP